MTLDYVPRMLCLLLAAYFMLHLTLGMLVAATTAWSIRASDALRPHIAARYLLAMRLGPAAGALLIVAGICLPSYLWHEPDAPGERVNIACLAAAVLTVIMWSVSLVRAWRTTHHSRRFLQRCRSLGRPLHLGLGTDAWLVGGGAPMIALVGILRPRLVISRPVMNALSGAQLRAALRHERAHVMSWDNLKRLLILIAPGVLPFSRSSQALERAWRRFAEWAADDRAVAGDPHRSCALAGALVCVARLCAGTTPPGLPVMLLGDSADLETRVSRLLSVSAAQPNSKPEPRTLLAIGGIVLMAASVGLTLLQTGVFYQVHAVLEHLVE